MTIHARFAVGIALYLIGATLTHGWVINRPALTSFPDCGPCVSTDAFMASIVWPGYWLYRGGMVVTKPMAAP